MSSQPSLSRRIAFGPFDYDVSSSELRKHGNAVRLQGQPLLVLSLLLGRAGDVVSRSELQRELWPGASSGDFEHGLNAAVNKLRQTLGDSADQPRYIETLPGRGYRFIAPMMRENSPKTVFELVAPARERTEPAVKRGPQATLPVAPVLVALAVLSGGLLWMALRESSGRTTQPPLQFTIEAPPGFALEGAGIRQSLAVSPDGRRIAFIAVDDSGLFRVFVREFNQLESRQIADSVGAQSLFWTPNGNLWFTARGKLRRTTVDGQASQVICDSFPYLSTGTAVSPDKLLLSSFAASGLVSTSGGSVERLKNQYTWPQFLPGGTHLLHSEFDPKTGRNQGLISAATMNGPPSKLLESDSRIEYTASLTGKGGYLMYLRSGTLLAHPFDISSLRTSGEAVAIANGIPSFSIRGAADFSVSERGVLAYQAHVSRSQLIWVDRAGRKLSEASPANLSGKSASLSPDGKHLAVTDYDVERGVSDVWLFDPKGQNGRRLISGPEVSLGPEWSPDSKKIVYVKAYEEGPRLFLRSIAEGSVDEPLPRGDFMMGTSWSTDGRFIIYGNSGLPQLTNDRQSDVYAIDLARGKKVVPLLVTGFHEANATLSPDGKWLAFVSNESGKTEVYAQAVEMGESIRVVGERRLVSRNGAQCIRWRRDGKELYYLGYDGRVYAVPVRAGKTFDAGTPQPLFRIGTEARASIHSLINFDVSADGSKFVIPSVTEAKGPSIVVVQNWEEALLHKR